jgi:RimJ/RimL family protein N-acetyltransferase
VPFAPDWPLETDRLILRAWTRDDLDAMFGMQSDAENARWLYNDARTRDETSDLLDRKIAGAELRAEGDWLSAAVALRETGEVVGDMSLHWVSDAHRQGEIGFIFDRAHHGRGYATESCLPLLRFAFDVMGLHRVIGSCEARNIGSSRVLEKLGMRREAHFVENELVKGEWQSGYVYALLAREWRERGG